MLELPGSYSPRQPELSAASGSHVELPHAGRPGYSARLLWPFLSALGAVNPAVERVVEELQKLDPEHRIQATYAHSLLRCMEDMVGDVTIGLRASEAMTTGDAGMFDFLMSSADTPRSAVAAAGRYIRLLSDVQRIWLQIEDERAVAHLECRLEVPRAVEDFALASMIRNQVFSWPEGMLEDMDVWFRHEAPRDIGPYRRALGNVRVNFGAPVAGWSFPVRWLDVPLSKSDARLHSVLRGAAEDILATLPAVVSVCERAAQSIKEKLSSGRVNLFAIAKSLHMHPRKLSRSLLREGTTFENLMESTRREIAVQLVESTDADLSVVARSAGFSGKAAFHRAFRRWMGCTPMEHRRRSRSRDDARARVARTASSSTASSDRART